MFVPPQLAPTFDAALRDVRAKTPEARAAALEVLSGAEGELRKPAIEAARASLGDEAAIVRVGALVALGRLRDEPSLDEILARVEDEDPTVREIALITATELGGERAESAVLAALTSPRPEMRFQAVAAIADLAPERARGHIVPRLEDDDPKVRAHAASALASLGDAPGSRRALGALLADRDPEVCAEAAMALATLGDARAIPHVVRLLDDAERSIAAAELLGRFDHEAARSALARLARAMLKPLMLKAAASASLARLGDRRGVEGLKRVLGAWRADGRTYAVTAIGELGLAELAPEVIALADRPRGADPVAIAECLARLRSQSELADEALAKMADRADEAGARARELRAR